MFKITEFEGKFIVEHEIYTKVFWFFGKVTWEKFYFRDRYGADFSSYHEALQALLLKIEFDLNMAYLDAK